MRKTVPPKAALVALLGCALTVAACGSSGSVVRNGSSGAGSSGATASSGATGPPPASTTVAPSSTAPSAPAATGPTVVVTPSHNLAARQLVTVQAHGFQAGEALQIVECAFKGAATGPGDCNLTAMQSVAADATGALTAKLPVVRGPFGANKIVCGPSQACLVSVTQASLHPTDEADALITFATR